MQKKKKNKNSLLRTIYSSYLYSKIKVSGKIYLTYFSKYISGGDHIGWLLGTKWENIFQTYP
jgi:hypothetical protein